MMKLELCCQSFVMLLVLTLASLARAGNTDGKFEDLPRCSVYINSKAALTEDNFHYNYYYVYNENTRQEGLKLSFHLPITEDEGTQSYSLSSGDAQFVNLASNTKIGRLLNEYIFANVECEISDGICVFNHTFYNTSIPSLNTPEIQSRVTDHLVVVSVGINVCELDLVVSKYPEAIELDFKWIHFSNLTSKLDVTVLKGFPLPVKLDDLVCDGQEVDGVDKVYDGYHIKNDQLRKYTECTVKAFNDFPKFRVSQVVKVSLPDIPEEVTNSDVVTKQESENPSNDPLVIGLSVGVTLLGLIILGALLVYKWRRNSNQPANEPTNQPATSFHVHNYCNSHGQGTPEQADVDTDGVPNHIPAQPTSLADSDTASSGFDESHLQIDCAVGDDDLSSCGSGADNNNIRPTCVHPTAESGAEAINNDYTTEATEGDLSTPCSNNIDHPTGEYKVHNLDETK